MKKILLVFVLTLLFVACGGSEKFYFTLDNPTSEKIVLNIDGKEYSLDAYSHEKLDLTVGEHTIENNEYKINFIVFDNSKGGIINPTGSPYIIERIIYAVEDTSEKAMTQDVDFEIDGYPFYGPVSVTTDFIIDRSYQSIGKKGAWDFDIFEVAPEETKIYRDVNILKKIYNKNEFLDMVEAVAPELRLDYEQNKKVVKTKPTFRKEEDNYEKNMAIAESIKDENTKKYAIEVAELDKQYAQAKDAKEQKRIRENFKKAWKEYIQASLKMSDEAKLSMRDYVAPGNFDKGIIINSVVEK